MSQFSIFKANFLRRPTMVADIFSRYCPRPTHPPTILVLLRPWFYKPIKRHPNNINWSSSSVVNFEHVFVSWGIFKSNHSEKLWKMSLLKHLNFQGNMWRISSIVTVLFIAKTWNFTKRYSSKGLTLQVNMHKISPDI